MRGTPWWYARAGPASTTTSPDRSRSASGASARVGAITTLFFALTAASISRGRLLRDNFLFGRNPFDVVTILDIVLNRVSLHVKTKSKEWVKSV